MLSEAGVYGRAGDLTSEGIRGRLLMGGDPAHSFGYVIIYYYLCGMRNFLKAIVVGYLVIWVWDIIMGNKD